ncbi:MAG: hypothetical protein JXQ97_01430 [Natronospirillum sp.]
MTMKSMAWVGALLCGWFLFCGQALAQTTAPAVDSSTLGAEIIRLNVTRQSLEERLRSVQAQHARLQLN